MRSKYDWETGRTAANETGPRECDTGVGEFLGAAVNQTISALAGAVLQDASRRLNFLGPLSSTVSESAGIGLGWLRSLLGRSEWTLPCVDVKVRL